MLGMIGLPYRSRIVSKPAQVFQPPNTLRLKVGGGFAGIDAAAVARAEQALKAMSGQFDEWLNDEITKLDAAGAAVRASQTPETMNTLYMRAHDLKGLGATYQYPLVTRMAASLCKLIDEPVRMRAPMFLIDAHINAIKAVVRDQIQTDEHPVGLALSTELESNTAKHLGAL